MAGAGKIAVLFDPSLTVQAQDRQRAPAHHGVARASRSAKRDDPSVDGQILAQVRERPTPDLGVACRDPCGERRHRWAPLFERQRTVTAADEDPRAVATVHRAQRELVAIRVVVAVELGDSRLTHDMPKLVERVPALSALPPTAAGVVLGFDDSCVVHASQRAMRCFFLLRAAAMQRLWTEDDQ